MQVAAAQLDTHLRRGLSRLYTVHGDEPLLVQEAADAIRAAARAQGHTERKVHTVTGAYFDWSAVRVDAGAMSLFGDRQLLELRLPGGKPGKDGAAALQTLAEGVEAQPDTVLLVLLPRLDGTALKSAWLAALERAGVVVRVDPVERAALPGWIAQRLQRHGQHVAAGEAGQQTLQFFADRVEGNLLAAHQEVEKLALLHPAGELSLEQVQQAVLNVARYTPFKLAEAVLAGQLERLPRLLEGLEAEGEAAVLVHWALAEDIRLMHRLRQALDAGRPMPLALREARVWGPKEQRLERLLPRLNTPQTARWLMDAHLADGVVKGLRTPGWPPNPWQALTQLASQVARGCAAALARVR